MKNKIVFYILAALFLTALIVCGILFSAENPTTVSKDELPPNFEELLKDKYGESDYACVIGAIKVDIESYAVIKYFIKYSWVTGDQSHLELVINIESTDQTPLDQTASSSIRCGNLILTPYYEVFLEYPQDGEFLGYKKQLFARYLPFKAPQKTFDILVQYGSEQFVLKNIPFVCYY